MQNTNTQTNNYVYLAAENACIVVKVNNVTVATDVQTADALIQVFFYVLSTTVCIRAFSPSV